MPDDAPGDSHEWRVILEVLRCSLAESGDRWTTIGA